MNATQPFLESLPVLVEVEHLARILSFHPESVRRLIRRGKIKATRFGQTWRIHRNEVARIVEHGI